VLLGIVGVLFALAARTFWGLYILIGAALGRHTTEGNGLALGMIVAAPVAVPVGVADSGTARRNKTSPRRAGDRIV
jgi:inner membrane transporter RhtA